MTSNSGKIKRFALLFALATSGSVACSSHSDDGAGVDSLENGSDDAHAVDTQGDDSSVAASDDPTDSQGDGTSSYEECAEISASAEIAKSPSDIVIVVDNSPTMTKEAKFVEAQVNVLAKKVVDSGVDAHVVLISAASPDDKQGVCISPPLGSGSCPSDSVLPTYLHVDESVSSHRALEVFLETHNEWKHMRRPLAMLSILVVSDDDSHLSSAEFLSGLSQLDPPIEAFVFHAIVAGDDGELTAQCDEYAADEGAVYKELVSQTSGVLGDLCLQDGGEFEKVFDEIAEQVIGFALPCSWLIPEPPAGETFDPDKVNVRFDDGSGGGSDIGAVGSGADCASVASGWYYDDPSNPQRILLCPQTCEAIQDVSEAAISILFGCETRPAEPVV